MSTMLEAFKVAAEGADKKDKFAKLVLREADVVEAALASLDDDERPILTESGRLRAEAELKRAMMEARPNEGRHGWSQQAVASYASKAKRRKLKAELESHSEGVD